MNKKKSQIQYTENPLGSIATINNANGAVSEEKIKKIEHKRIDEGGLSRLYNHIKDNGTFAVIGSQDKDTGEDIEPQFEVNLPTTMIQSYIDNAFEGWSTIKKTVSSQEYDIPRGSVISHLTTNVITFVGQAT